ncbi:MAG: tRNA (adenosine(37)-N6)-dimethylallyltransferase MiaA [Acidimicrobiales bacterium]
MRQPQPNDDVVAPLAIIGTTASGKSALALELARRDPTVELVSVDSMQVYRGMDIGTAKPTAAEQAEVPHHLIDLVAPDADFGVSRFQAACREVLAAIAARGHRAVLVGGTALYLRAIIDDLTIPGQHPDARAAVEADPDTASLHRRLADLDPLAAARIDPANRRRLVRALEVTIGSGRPFSSFGPGLDAHPETAYRLVALNMAPSVNAARIEERFGEQLAAGFVEEVRGLAGRPGGLARTARQAVGYRELLRHIEDGAPLEDCVEEAISRTRQMARRQRAWFRRDPRITWLPVDDDPHAAMPSLLMLANGHT